ncbi:MAG: hypothetical protein LBL23_08030 [Coriobacteriales bacterium]|jgi:hypothetical protein|nr:hypothetical protein [Coriobacteriales bacterium]
MNGSNEPNAPQLPESRRDDLGAGYLIAALVDYLLLAVCGFFAVLVGGLVLLFYHTSAESHYESFFLQHLSLMITSAIPIFLVFLIAMILYFCIRRNKLRSRSWTGPVIRRLVVFLAVVVLNALIFFQLF